MDIKKVLSIPRMSTYEAESKNLEEALLLYQQNFEISGAFLPVLHMCEVMIRNAVSHVLEEVYGVNWAWSQSFFQSLPTSKIGYSPTVDLKNARKHKQSVGKVIPDLKFVFWQKMFTQRNDNRLWDKYLDAIFPNFNTLKTVKEKRNQIHNDLDIIRRLRNRIAHHEPIIFKRDLQQDYNLIIELMRRRCLTTSRWVENNQKVTSQLLILDRK